MHHLFTSRTETFCISRKNKKVLSNKREKIYLFRKFNGLLLQGKKFSLSLAFAVIPRYEETGALMSLNQLMAGDYK